VRTGTYTPTNSSSPGLIPSTYANPANAYQVGGAYTNVSGNNTASAALSGSHKFTFTWKGGTGSAPVPKSVVVKIDGQAGWGLPQSASPGTCNITGGEGILVVDKVILPKTATNPNNTGSVQKVWYSLKNTPPQTFDITVNTSANATATGNSNTDSQGSVSVGAGVMVRVTSIGVNLTGTTIVGGQDNILIGQGCSADFSMSDNAKGLVTPPAGYGPPNPDLQNLLGAGVTLGSTVDGVTTGYKWTVGGEKFDRYEVSTTGSTGTVIAYDEAELAKPIPRRWIWRVPNAATTVTGEADVKAGTSSTNLGKAIASKTVKVVPPLGTGQGVADKIEIVSLEKLMATVFYFGNLLTPTEFHTARNGIPDLGRWTFVQLITMKRTYKKIDGIPQNTPFYNQKGLDTSYPYSLAYYPADGTVKQTSDSPSFPLKSDIVNIKVSDEAFEMYLTYRPPLKEGLPNDWVDFVSVHRITWKWSAELTRAGSDWGSYTSMPNLPTPTVIEGDENWYQHPEWMVRVYAGNIN
jgi:hypothetical protein